MVVLRKYIKLVDFADRISSRINKDIQARNDQEWSNYIEARTYEKGGKIGFELSVKKDICPMKNPDKYVQAVKVIDIFDNHFNQSMKDTSKNKYMRYERDGICGIEKTAIIENSATYADNNKVNGEILRRHKLEIGMQITRRIISEI